MKKISHSYIIEGKTISELDNNSKHLLKIIFCENNNCNNCKQCNLISTNGMPNIITFNGFENKIKSEDISIIKNFLNYKIQLNKKIVIFLKGFEHATPKAVNSLLKILEEPFDGFVFILATLNKRAIPETIISRCQDFFEKENDYTEHNSEYKEEINLIKLNKFWDIDWKNFTKNKMQKFLNDFSTDIIKDQNPLLVKKILKLNSKIKNNISFQIILVEFLFLLSEFKYDQ